jgi:hypothetical protein
VRRNGVRYDGQMARACRLGCLGWVAAKVRRLWPNSSNEGPSRNCGETSDDPQGRDDLHAYVDYWQARSLEPGWEEAFDIAALKRWVQENSHRLNKAAEALQPLDPDTLVRSYAAEVRDFRATGRFDSPLIRRVFAPLLDQVHAAAQRRRIAIQRAVHVAASTDLAATPASLPSSGDHLLFVGLGTAAFCNYWAKAFTSVIKGLWACRGFVDTPDRSA